MPANMKSISFTLSSICASITPACGGGGSSYDTIGDATIAFAQAWCDRAIECALVASDDRDGCESVIVDGVCDEVDCYDDLESSSSDVEQCLDALASFSCSALDDGQIPPRCRLL